MTPNRENIIREEITKLLNDPQAGIACHKEIRPYAEVMRKVIIWSDLFEFIELKGYDNDLDLHEPERIITLMSDYFTHHGFLIMRAGKMGYDPNSKKHEIKIILSEADRVTQ